MPYSAYILASKRNGTLYTGITRDLPRRVSQHRDGQGSEFVQRYAVFRLVWAESYDDVHEAIAAESGSSAGGELGRSS